MPNQSGGASVTASPTYNTLPILRFASIGTLIRHSNIRDGPVCYAPQAKSEINYCSIHGGEPVVRASVLNVLSSADSDAEAR